MIKLSFKYSNSKYFKKAYNLCGLSPTFEDDGKRVSVTFAFNDIIHPNSKAYKLLIQIYFIVVGWVGTEVSFVGNDRYTNFVIMDFLRKQFEGNQTSFEIADLINPYEYGSDQWTNWEIDNYEKLK